MDKVLGIGLVVAALMAFSKKPAPGTPGSGESKDGSLTIKIYDSEGKEVPHNSPSTLDPGQIYTVSVQVTNKSNRGGVLIPDTLRLAVAGVDFGLPYQEKIDAYAAGEMRSYDFTFTSTPSPGIQGIIGAYVAAQTGGFWDNVASATRDVNIQYPITHAATVAFA